MFVFVMHVCVRVCYLLIADDIIFIQWIWIEYRWLRFVICDIFLCASLMTMMMINVSKKKKKSNIYDYPCMSIICKWDGPMVHKQTNTKKSLTIWLKWQCTNEMKLIVIFHRNDHTWIQINEKKIASVKQSNKVNGR